MANAEDKRRSKMNVLVNELIQDEPNPAPTDCIIKSKDIICPECKENIKLNVDEYHILLYGCRNKHDKDLFIDEFNETQNINLKNKINAMLVDEGDEYSIIVDILSFYFKYYLYL